MVKERAKINPRISTEINKRNNKNYIKKMKRKYFKSRI